MHRLRSLCFRASSRPVRGKPRQGQTLVEYSLILAMIAVLALAFLAAQGNDLLALVVETLRAGPER